MPGSAVPCRGACRLVPPGRRRARGWVRECGGGRARRCVGGRARWGHGGALPRRHACRGPRWGLSLAYRVVMSAAAERPGPRVPSPLPAQWRRRSTSHLPVVDETSAGGLVVTVFEGRAYTAIIARRNRAGRLEWCLPKGHLEGMETAQEAAVRDIAAETGITGRVLGHLATIDYWFAGHDRRVHKVVHHYLLEALGGALTTENDPDHEAEDVAWVSLAQVASRLAYPNERRVVATARDILAGRS